ncbi:hypothetical protein ACJJTC_010867 [Scirpophaga incertulas]
MVGQYNAIKDLKKHLTIEEALVHVDFSENYSLKYAEVQSFHFRALYYSTESTYNEHQWSICVDLKMVNFLLGQQSGYTKYPCFICLWDSRAKEDHWKKVVWPARENMTVGASNIINKPLVDRGKNIFSPLHIKLGLMKQFVRALDKDGQCFKYIWVILQNLVNWIFFPGLSMEKIKAGIFSGPQIRQIIKDEQFLYTMTDIEASAWKSFVLVVHNFLGNHKSPNYEEIVQKMLSDFKTLKANMSLQHRFLMH